jgi:hypothetical protein
VCVCVCVRERHVRVRLRVQVRVRVHDIVRLRANVNECVPDWATACACTAGPPGMNYCFAWTAYPN